MKKEIDEKTKEAADTKQEKSVKKTESKKEVAEKPKKTAAKKEEKTIPVQKLPKLFTKTFFYFFNDFIWCRSTGCNSNAVQIKELLRNI